MVSGDRPTWQNLSINAFRRRDVLHWAAHVALLLGLLVVLFAPFVARAQSTGPIVVVGSIDGTITPVMATYIERTIHRAENRNAAAVVFEMDTPGGLSSAMDDIVRDILQSSVPVVVYVTPRGARAASAGVYIAYAAHIAAMAPGTNIGSASPVSGNGSDLDTTMKKKVTNDAVAQITNLATLRGRNADWAKSAVIDAVNVTADEALSLGVVDLTATSLDDLIARIDGRTVQMASGPATIETTGARIETSGMSLFDQFFQLLADPTIAYLLVSLGLLGVYIELSHPGVTLPGVVGLLSLVVGLFALGTLPVNWAGVALIALAFGLFALDLFVTSFGTLLIGGLASFIAGSYLLFGSDAPPGYRIARPAIWTMAGCLAAFSLLLGFAVLKARLRPPATGVQRLVGTIADVRELLNPAGMVFVHGERWEAEMVDPAVPSGGPGSRVVITAVDGMRLRVRPATAADIERAPATRVDRRRVLGHVRPSGRFM